MTQRGLPREKVLATVVHLLETTLIRVGNEDYAKENKSFGLTTLRNRHVDVNGKRAAFRVQRQERQDVEAQDRETGASRRSSSPARNCPGSTSSNISMTTTSGRK